MLAYPLRSLQWELSNHSLNFILLSFLAPPFTPQTQALLQYIQSTAKLPLKHHHCPLNLFNFVIEQAGLQALILLLLKRQRHLRPILCQLPLGLVGTELLQEQPLHRLSLELFFLILQFLQRGQLLLLLQFAAILTKCARPQLILPLQFYQPLLVQDELTPLQPPLQQFWALLQSSLLRALLPLQHRLRPTLGRV